MKEDNDNSLIPIGSTGLVRVGNSIDITNKIIKEHEERSISQIFNSVKIGNQYWMTKNLDVDCYANGDPIPQVQNPKEWDNLRIGAYCYYDNDSNNGLKYGKLYNYFAIKDERGLAPSGFCVSKLEDWKILFHFLGENALLYKSTNGWKDNGNGNNQSRMNILPGGHRMTVGAFFGLNEYTCFWTSNEFSAGYSLYIDFSYYSDSAFIFSEGANWKRGYYIRCLKF